MTTGPTGYVRPKQRPLKIFAVDPMQGRLVGNRATIWVENEPLLAPGPVGERIEVVDYDGAHDRFYPAVHLNHPDLLVQGGMEPSESDPRFHQQMVYAVAMRTIENFDRALGRRVSFRKSARRPRLRVYPHAFYGANAFFDSDLHAVLFGYFSADRQNPGANLPDQTIFTCLSHDIIAHEVTHAIVHRLRKHFMEPSNQDVLAFHEAFSDIVALFQHFSYRDLLREHLQRSRGDIRSRSMMVDLAGQFGQALGTGRALRTAIDRGSREGPPDPTRIKTAFEPHERGSILVSAVFDAFFSTYGRRTRDLIRIATGGTGTLPEGDLHPDLVARVAGEAARAAQQQLSMCIRAFDYLPPVDITFGDYLRALVTADFELNPEDEWGQRAALIEAFRQRGIYPDQVVSLAEESLLWPRAPDEFPKLDLLEGIFEAGSPDTAYQNLYTLLNDYVIAAATDFSRNRPEDPASGAQETARGAAPSPSSSSSSSASKFRMYRQMQQAPAAAGAADEEERRRTTHIYRTLYAWATRNMKPLRLRPDLKIQVLDWDTVFRVSPTGRLLIELVVQFAQEDDGRNGELGGLPARGGTTVVATLDGTVRYVIAKPLPNGPAGGHLEGPDEDAARRRIDLQAKYVGLCDAMDPGSAYLGPKEHAERMRLRMNLHALHGGL